MSAGVHIELDILFSMFCVLLYYQQKKHKVFDFLGTTTFNSLLWASICIMIVDGISWFFMGNLLPHSDLDLMLIQTVYYFIQVLLPYYFVIYCINTTGKKLSRLATLLLGTPVLITGVILAVNARTSFAFYVEDNMVLRGSGFALAIISPMLYVTAAMVLCTVFYLISRKSGDPEKKRIAFHMFVCLLICFTGAVSCAFINYISPWYSFVAALIYLYIQLHSHRERNLDALAYTDSLTGLKNYASYAHIKEKIERKLAENPDTEFAIAMMDVNNLKKTNDLHGHHAGDALIVSAAKLMCKTFSHSPVCRIGGDEFVAILENGDYEKREELYRQFMDEMKVTTFTAEDITLPLTVALGICKFDRTKHASFDDTFQEADSIMYENKAAQKCQRK